MRPTTVLLLIALLIVIAANEGAGKSMDVVNSAVILDQIKNNMHVAYDRVIVVGDLDVSTLNMPLRPAARSYIDLEALGLSANQSKIVSPIKITNSIIEGNVNCNDTFFQEPIDLENTRFSGIAYFDGSQFDKWANFRFAEFSPRTSFISARFNQSADFFGAEFVGAKFRRDVDLRGATFEGINNLQGKLNLTDIDFSGKFRVRWDTIKDILICNGPVYIALIKSFKDLEQFDDSNSCYYQYRVWSQNIKPFGLSKIWDCLAWATCGYGISWLNTILFALVVSVFFTFIYSAKAWHKTSIKPDYGELFWLSIIILVSAPKEMFPAGAAKFEELAKEYWYLSVIERVIGWGLLVLMINILLRLTMRF